ncbi:glutathione S-transferase family protein [Falsiroseomonas sp. HC035]|uniref:glutathione S-transferase family protein n=1 Tax=Falsiroseomonas sp. HC035 TaxID=3390999 RepID=UPI003D313AE6
MKLYQLPLSDACRPVLLFAAEEGITLEMEILDLLAGDQFSERFVAINPNSAVPVLEDGPLRLTEGSAILKYLADRIGSPFYPRDVAARARVNERLDWFNTGFHREYCMGLVWPQAMPDRYGWPDAAMQAAVLRRSGERARRYLDVLDRHWLPVDSTYLGGMAPDLSDCLGACYVSTGVLVGFDFSPWPRVSTWLSAMRRRDAWRLSNEPFESWCAQRCAARSTSLAA